MTLMKIIVLLLILHLPLFLMAQPSWKRNDTPVEVPVSLFHSSQTANLPTTETLQKGNFMYEISHRFGTITSGYEGLYGFDGPVNMRTALSYGITDNVMFSLGRSNIQDNLDLRVKYKLYEDHFFELPVVFAIQGGTAINTEVYNGLKKRPAFNSENFQYYGQFIFNTMIGDKLGLGMVPSVVYNSYIFASEYETESKYTVSLPGYLQYYFNRMWSIFFEYTPVLAGWKGNIYFDASGGFKSHNSVGTGIAIETGGHVFFLFMTNNERLNPTQFLTGAGERASARSAWRLAFVITREL